MAPITDPMHLDDDGYHRIKSHPDSNNPGWDFVYRLRKRQKKMTNTLLRKANLTPLCDVGPCPPMTINIAFIIYHSENSGILHLSCVRMKVPQQEKKITLA